MAIPAPQASEIRKSSPGATAPRACWLRVGIPAKWSLADVPECWRPPPARIPVRTTAGAATDRGRRTLGRAAGGAKHVMLPSPAIRLYRPTQPRRGRAGRASASRRSGARRSPWALRPSPAARIPIRAPAVAATDNGRRGAGTGRGHQAAGSANLGVEAHDDSWMR